MPLYRSEFDKTINRLKLIQDELTERGFPQTVQTLSEAIILLNQVDSVYIQELAKKDFAVVQKLK